LKTSLLPQLLEVVNQNQSYSERIKIFELANVYLKSSSKGSDSLPEQPLKLGLVTKGVPLIELKGVFEGLLAEMGVVTGLEEFEVVDFGGEKLGIEVNFEDIIKKATKTKTYTPLTGYNSIKEDLTFDIPVGVLYPQVEETIFKSDERIYKLKFKDIYENSLTFSIEYLDRKKQISSQDTQEIRKKIFDKLEKIGVRLKG